MAEVAIITKIVDVLADGKSQYGTSIDAKGHPRCTHLELAMLGGPGLNYCSNHPAVLWFDGEVCPCCGLMAENKGLFGL